MENLVTSFEAVLPLFLCILLGMFLRRIGMLEESVRQSLNKLCFKVFLPIYLFNNIYGIKDISAAFDLRLILFACIGLIAAFCVLMLVIPRVEKENSRRGVMIQAMFRSNFALIGLPLAQSLGGDEALAFGAVISAFVQLSFNSLAVIALTSASSDERGQRLRKIGGQMIRNPMIIASLLGLAFNLLNIPLYTDLRKTIINLGKVATPLSMVALGASFTFASTKVYRKQLLLGVSGKLIISPLLMVTLGALLGFRAETLVPILIYFGAPTAVSSFPMAQQMDGDGELAASLVVFTSALSIVTIFLWVFVLKTLALI